MKRMAVISAGFVPVPAVDGGAGEVLTTEIIEGNEKSGDYFMDIYTVESPKLREYKYHHAEIIQLHISLWNKLICKFRNSFLKLFRFRYRFIPYNRILLKKFRDNYDMILIENNMQVYEDILKHTKNGTDNMIYHMHNDIDGTTKPEDLCKLIADTAKTILPVSEYLKNHFNEIAPNNRMKVFYNCVDLNVFDTNNAKQTVNLKQKYSINEKDFIYMYTGRICPEKGILELIRAFKIIAKDQPNAKLLIVGSRWYNQIAKDKYFKLLIKEATEIKDKIIFTGYIFPNEMPEIYALADVLVIPSMWEEPFGVVALEGMAMKIPIIATNSGGLTEVLDTSISIIIDKNTNVVDNLKSAMLQMINSELRIKLAKNAYELLIRKKEFHQDYYYENFKSKI